MLVPNLKLGDALLQGFAVVLRISARSRNCTHVDYHPHVRAPKHLDELANRPCRMPNSEERESHRTYVARMERSDIRGKHVPGFRSRSIRATTLNTGSRRFSAAGMR